MKHALLLAASVVLSSSSCKSLRDNATPSNAPSSSTSSSASATPSATLPPVTSLPSEVNPEHSCAITNWCERKCQTQCEQEKRDRSSFYEAKRLRIKESPFSVDVVRAYLQGSCARGDKPEEREDAEGIRVIVEGSITYTGLDPLSYAVPTGLAYLRFDATRFAEEAVAVRSQSYWGSGERITRLKREARGSDPWKAGQKREFVWKSQYFDAVYCGLHPIQAEAYIALEIVGAQAGHSEVPVQLVPLDWDSVMGSSIAQDVYIPTQEGLDVVEKPGKALFSKLDQVLVEQFDSKRRWLPRSGIVQLKPPAKGASASFPLLHSTPDWDVRVLGTTDTKSFGGYTPPGEDQFLTVVELELSYRPQSSGKTTKANAVKFRLETSPDSWRTPLSKASGQLEGTTELAPGQKIQGKLVFARQQFERPFRLEIKTPDKTTSELSVFREDLGKH